VRETLWFGVLFRKCLSVLAMQFGFASSTRRPPRIRLNGDGAPDLRDPRMHAGAGELSVIWDSVAAGRTVTPDSAPQSGSQSPIASLTRGQYWTQVGPNSVKLGKTRCNRTNRGSEEMPENTNCLAHGEITCHDVRRLSSAVHSTTLPPLQALNLLHKSVFEHHGKGRLLPFCYPIVCGVPVYYVL
jgi:hypothetical protein